MHNKLGLLVLLLFCFSLTAQAKIINYGKRSGFAVNFATGITGNPSVNYVPEPTNYKRSFTTYYSIGPSIDAGNWALEPTITWYDHPSFSGDNSRYLESVQANTFVASGKLRLFPFFLSARARTFFGLSYGVGQTYLFNKRAYANGSFGEERLKGKASMFTSFLGVEGFIVQNYVANIELGFRNFLIGDLKHKGDTDASNATVTTGGSKLTPTGRKSFFVFRGFYAQLGFGVQF